MLEDLTAVINRTLPEQQKVIESRVDGLMNQNNITRVGLGKSIDRDEDAEILEDITWATDEYPNYGYRRITPVVNKRREAQNKPRVGKDRIARIMNEANLSKEQGNPIDRSEDAEILEDITWAVDKYPNYGYERITVVVNERREAQNKSRVGEKRIFRIMKEANLLKKQGNPIDRSEDSEILELVKRILDKNPHYTPSNLKKEINKIRLAQEKPKVSEERNHKNYV